MSTITDAVFFFKDGQIVQEMMKTEFDALVDGVVDAPEYKGRKMAAVYLQITDTLKIRSLIFFIIAFDKQGHVQADWNVPLNQLIQSAGRGMDLGAGLIRLVTKQQCQIPWLQEMLWEPPQQVYAMLVQAVKGNRLGVAESDDAWLYEEDALDIPIVTVQPPTLTQIPTLGAAVVPTLESAEDGVHKQELAAMKAAFSVRLDKLQKERDELKEKNRVISDTIKQQAQEHLEAISRDFNHDVAQKEQQIKALKDQLQNEQQRYTALKEQQAEQAAQFQLDREELVEKAQRDQSSKREIDALKLAFAKELAAKIEEQTTQVNERLAMREVELFYREEQMNLLQDEVAQLKQEKQDLLNNKGRDILQALEDKGVTLVMFQLGLGHITLGFDDVGSFLNDKTEYLASRYHVSPQTFLAWQRHYHTPVCQNIAAGRACGKAVPRVELLSHFVLGQSNRCEQHQE